MAAPITRYGVKVDSSFDSSFLPSSFSTFYALFSDFDGYFLISAGSPLSSLKLASLTRPLSSYGSLLEIPILSASKT